MARAGLGPRPPRQPALPALLSDPPTLLVLDLARAPRAAAEAAWQLLLATPIVALAEGMDADAVAALLERGAFEVLTRDTEDDALLAATVAVVLRRRRDEAAGAGRPVLLTLGGTTIDLADRRVRRADGTTRSLSRTEFALLEALLGAKGRPCSQQELTARVWGAEQASAAHYLRLYVRYLREKLEDDPRHPRHLLNVWGRDHRLLTDQPATAPAPAAPPATAQLAGSACAASA